MLDNQVDVAVEPTAHRSKRLKLTPKGHESVPADRRPVFEFKRFSFRQWRDTAAEVRDAERSNDVLVQLDSMLAVLRRAIKGWSNVTDEDGNPVAYDPDKLGDVADLGEISSLYAQLMQGGVTDGTVKNSI